MSIAPKIPIVKAPVMQLNSSLPNSISAGVGINSARPNVNIDANFSIRLPKCPPLKLSKAKTSFSIGISVAIPTATAPSIGSAVATGESAVDAAIRDAANAVAEVVGGIGNAVAGSVEAVGGAVGEILSPVAGAAGQVLDAAGNVIGEVANVAGEAVSGLATAIGNATAGLVPPPIPPIPIPPLQLPQIPPLPGLDDLGITLGAGPNFIAQTLAKFNSIAPPPSLSVNLKLGANVDLSALGAAMGIMGAMSSVNMKALIDSVLDDAMDQMDPEDLLCKKRDLMKEFSKNSLASGMKSQVSGMQSTMNSLKQQASSEAQNAASTQEQATEATTTQTATTVVKAAEAATTTATSQEM